MGYKNVYSYCTLRRRPHIFALKTETKLRKNKVTQFQPLQYKSIKKNKNNTHTHKNQLLWRTMLRKWEISDDTLERKQCLWMFVINTQPWLKALKLHSLPTSCGGEMRVKWAAEQPHCFSTYRYRQQPELRGGLLAQSFWLKCAHTSKSRYVFNERSTLT